MVLRNCEINVPINFDRLDINFKLVIENTVFNENVNFAEISVAHGTHIRKCNFNKSVGFYGCNFNEGEFTDVTFNNDVRFTNAVTDEGRLNYDQRTRFNGFFYFTCNFQGNVIFNNVDFEYVNFPNTIFPSSNIFQLQNCRSFGITMFRNLYLGKNVVFKNINLTNFSFLFSKFDECLFIDCEIDLKNFIDERIYLEFKNPNENFDSNLKIAFDEQSAPTLKQILAMLRIFEVNFDKHKDFDLAGKFYQKRLELQKKNEKNLFKKIILSSYEIFSGYGESYFRPIAWAFSFIVFFSLIYLMTGIVYFESDNSSVLINRLHTEYSYNIINDFACSLLYSLNSSTPFRQILEIVKPANGLTSFFSILQTLVQTSLLALFIVALNRKFKR